MKRALEIFIFLVVPFASLYFLYAYRKKLERAIHFAWLGWKGFDWDYAYSEQLLLAGLKRLNKKLTGPEGVVNWDYDDEHRRAKKSLQLTIKLLEKTKEEYDSWKGEEIKTNFIDSDNLGYKQMVFENSTETIKAWRDCYMKDERRRRKHKTIAYNIIAKYHEYWWD